MRIDSEGGADQAGVVVARMNPPCNPAGLAFGPDGRLYITGFGAAGDEIGVVTPSDADPANPPVATGFATGTPGANGVAFDEDGNLYVSDGGTAQGRVFRVGPAGGAAAVLFRVPPMANSVGVGRQNQALQPPATGAPPATQGIVANGLAFGRDGALFVADTARGALWRVELEQARELRTPTGCDTTYTADTLCLDALFVQHPALDGADGIALDRAGNVWVDANERNAIARRRPPAAASPSSSATRSARASLRNAGPLEFPTSPVLAGRTLCTTSSDGNRRDNSPNTAGEAAPASAVVGKVSCLDQEARQPGRAAARRLADGSKGRAARCGASLRSGTPLHGATDRRRVGDGRRRSGKHGVKGVAQVVGGDRRLVPAVVDRPVVDEPAVAVEDEDLGRPLGSERARDALALVVQVVEVESLLPRAHLHLLEGVLGVARDIVRRDRDDADAALGVVPLDRDQPSFPRLDVGAVVAGLDEHERRASS